MIKTLLVLACTLLLVSLSNAQTTCSNAGCWAYSGATLAQYCGTAAQGDPATKNCKAGCASGYYAVYKTGDPTVADPAAAANWFKLTGAHATELYDCRKCPTGCPECIDTVTSSTTTPKCRRDNTPNPASTKAYCTAGYGVGTQPNPSTITATSTWDCVACSPGGAGCIDCSDDKGKCKTCNTTGYYLNGTSGDAAARCDACPTGCRTCTNSTTCTACTNASVTPKDGKCFSLKTSTTFTIAVFIGAIVSALLF